MASPSALTAVCSPATVGPSSPSATPIQQPLKPMEVEIVPPGAEPASMLQGIVADGMALIVAPSIGRFHPVMDSGLVDPETVVAVVNGGGGRADEVRVPVAAELHGLLALEGQIVQTGQALAWVRRLDP